MYEYQYNYKKIHKEPDGWVDPEKHLPLSYKIVKLKTNLREINGWWAESEWFIRNQKKDERVISWKRSNDVHNI